MKIEIPKVQTVMFDCVRFVCLAAAKESTRYAIAKVLVEKGRFVATDGRRLHIADIDHGYKLGLYEIMKCNRSIVILLKSDAKETFPKYRDIIPKHKDYFEVRGSGGPLPASVIAAYALARKDQIFNPEYLADALDGGDNWKVSFGGDRLIICKMNFYKSKNGKTALIMPITSPIIEEYKTGKPKKSKKKA